MIIFVSLSDRGAMFHHRQGWEKLLSDKLNIKYNFLSRKDSSHAKFIFNVLLHLIKLKPRLIVFINGEYSPFILFIHFFSYFTFTKVIISWHDVTPHTGNIFNYFQWFIAFINSFLSSKVIIYNNVYKNKYFLYNKYIYMPLPPLILPFDGRVRSPIKKNGSIVFIGRIEYYKGLDRILEYYLASDCIIQLRHLFIIGNYPPNYKYKELLNNSDNVTFLGPLSDLEAYDLMLSSNAIIMPYRHCSQSFNPYWAGLTKNALIISSEVEHSLSIMKNPGVYVFSSRFQLSNYIDVKSDLLPFNHQFYSYESGISSLIDLYNEQY